ncbi:MAG: tetratricopeptide repeat protein [Gammaproteobacteria bacterium]|nr:tetratricopeptide repeat protein [Gammaproteobacteria bacterium]
MRYIAINNRLIDLESGRIQHREVEKQLPPRLLGLLRFLVDNSDRVLTRDEMIEAVWGHLEAASDDSVNVAVSSLRQFIGDHRRPPRVLRAVPRRGYLFDRRRVEMVDPEAASERLSQACERAGSAEQPAVDRMAGGKRRWRPLLLGLALVATAGFWWVAGERFTGSPGIAETAEAAGPGVAVLPFTDMTAVGDQGHFADGLVDRIIHMLTLSPELEVVARTSSFAFRDSKAGIGEIAERLDVDVVLEGSVQHSGDTVRVLAQLIDARTEKHIWSRTYDRPMGRLFALQDEIANEVARTMTDSLLPERDTPHPDSQRVWELITRGRLAMDDFTLASATAAVEHFEAALELQPDNVEALIGLIDAIGMQRSQGPMRTREDEHDMTEPFLERARRLAPDSAMVIRATGDWHFRNGRPEEAIAAYRVALERNPNDATAWRHLGRTLFRQSQFEAAIEPLKTAVRLDPFFEIGAVWLADAYWAVGRAEEALFRLRKSIRERPEFPLSYSRMTTYLTQVGDSGEAMRYILRQRELDPDSGSRWFRVCETWLQLGDVDAADRCSQELAAEHELPLLGRYLRQAIHRVRGEWQAQRAVLEEVVALGNPDPLTRTLLVESLARDDCPAAIELLEEHFSHLFDGPPVIKPFEFMPAKLAAYCLKQTGQTARSEPLMAAMWEIVERTRLDRGPWLIVGNEEASLHMLEGNEAAALDALEALVDRDWRYYWWALEGQPEYAPLLDDPRFQALYERLRAGVREQREYFEANRDKPLVALDT